MADLDRHIASAIRHAENGWDAAHDDEDTLTGEVGCSLRTDGFVTSTSDPEWCYRVAYKKLRGRGPRASEKLTGADGIVQVEVRRGEGPIDVKGILFQAKKRDGSSRADLTRQVEDMESIAPGGSAVFEYSDAGYRAQSGLEFKQQASDGRVPHPEETLAAFLSCSFLPCKSGLRGLYYDAVRGNLVVPLSDGTARIVKVSVGHRVMIEARRKVSPARHIRD